MSALSSTTRTSGASAATGLDGVSPLFAPGGWLSASARSTVRSQLGQAKLAGSASCGARARARPPSPRACSRAPRLRPSDLSSSSSCASASSLADRQHHVERASRARAPRSRPRPARRAAPRAPSRARARCPCPRAARGVRSVHLREAVEDPLELIRRKPDAGVGDRSARSRRRRALARSTSIRPPRSVNLSELPTRLTITFSSAS